MDYMGTVQIPVNNSEGIKRVVYMPHAPPKFHSKHETVAPYATDYGGSRPQRVSSAPIRRTVYAPRDVVGPTNPHRPSSALLRRPQETSVTRHAPYAARLNDSHFYTTNGIASATTNNTMLPHYDSLNDPHLQDYYVKKFRNTLLKAASPRRITVSSAARLTSGGKKKTKASEPLYKIAVTTGDKKNASTDAKIYIRIHGTKGKLPKHQLTKRKKKFKFTRGTTHIFKMTAKDIGDITAITIENDGLTKEQGWFLDQIEISKKIPKTGKEKTWVFVCQQWLSLHVGDCQTTRELYAKSYSKTEYEVVCVTGNQKGAGTDANVFVTIFGKSGNTPKLQLKSNHKDCFERNRTDIFKLKTNCVGPLKKIRIQHDNTGLGAGWYLERVVVTDLNNPKKWKFFFPCGTWLAKDEGDGQICRDLIGSRDPDGVRKLKKYKITVYTGDKRGAGTDANVYCNLFGELGDSGERKLDNNKNNFERGKTDEFAVECPALGKIDRLRIGHDNWGGAAGWFLDKVIVEDLEMGKVHEFPCGRWLATDEDDGAIARDLKCGVGATDPPPGIPYKLHVTTGDVKNAGTSARVYAILYGGKDGEQSSGKIWLEGGKFERGKTDIFEIEVAEMLSPLSRIEIGHDNSGPGSGWFLDKVIINCPSAGIEQWFMCDKWFATDEGDGLIERVLHESLGKRKQRKSLVTWYAQIYTSDIRGAGTDANVHMVVYGKNKKGDVIKSDEIVLDNKGDNFEAGETDRFKVEMIDIGKPFKMRIGHDNSGNFAGWHLDKVELENMQTKKKYNFTCGRWLATDEEDGEIIREMPAEGDDIKKPQQLLKYEVEVHTGKKRGAGTDANVFCNLFGEQGDTGERALRSSKTNRNKFEKGNVDIFEIEAVSLKKLKKIRIGHDGKSPGAGWYLDKVVVKDPLDGATEFECNRWLDIKEDDGLIVREITAGGSQMLESTSYHVSVKTGDRFGAGTDANVFVKIFGAKGDTGTLQLKSADNTGNKFERGRTDLYKLEATDIGKVEKIRIGHDGSNPGSGWFLDEVRLDVPSQGEHYIFACHRWLDTKEDDGQTEIEMEPTDFRKGQVKIPYEVTVWTGDIRGAGTDANVFLQMYGEFGKTEEYQLRNRTDNFEQGQMDKFKIEAEDVGPLLKVRIGHDGAKPFAGWFMEKLLIQRHPGKGSRRRKSLKRRQSIKTIGRNDVDDDSDDDRRRKKRRDYDDDSDEGKSFPRGLSRRPSSARRSRYGDDDDYEDTRKRGKRPGSARRRGDDSDDDRFKKRRSSSFGRRRYDDDEDDSEEDSRYSKRRQNQKRYLHDDDESPRVRRGKRGSRYGSDDDDEITDRRGRLKRQISTRSLSGRRRKDSDDEETPRNLKRRPSSMHGRRSTRDSDDSEDDKRKGKKGKKFQRKFDDESDDDKRKNDEGTETEDYWFVCKRWFDKKEDDGKIVRELLPTDENGNPLDTGLQEITYKVSVFTGDVFGAGTDANVLINITGEFGDTGERELTESNNFNKFETNQTDVFEIKAVELGKLKKLKIRHDNKGGGAAWFLGHVEIEDPKNKISYFFPCQRWLAKNEDDGQISRELVPVDQALKRKLSRKDSKSVLNEIALETKAALTTYHVYVHTGKKWGAGTDANVYIVLFGENDDTGMMFLKSSKNNKNKFERNQMDEFVIEAVDIGDLRKIKIGHDNAGGGGAWFLDKVEIDCPSLGKKWTFTCGRWLATDEDDGAIERELYPNENSTEVYEECMPYEITTYTSDISGAATDADVFIVLYGKDRMTSQKSLCSTKHERKDAFKRNAMNKFVVELEDVGETIEKIRIGHDGKGWGSGWHLDKVEVRRLKSSGKGSETYTFQCKRWLAKDEDDGSVVRELVPDQVTEEMTRKDGSVKKRTKERRDTLVAKTYTVNVYTGDIRGAGTDANVFITIFGDKGDTGERKLQKSETNKDKFERNQVDKFLMEAVDLGKVFKVKIRHDNALISPAWYLDKVEVVDNKDNETYTFHCERWLAKNKDDKKIERTLYVKGYEGDMTCSSSTLMSSRRHGSMTSLDSARSSDPFSKSPRLSKRQLEEIPEGPTIPYTVKIITGEEKDMGTESNAWIKICGKKTKTSKLYLELAQKKGFEPGSMETFSIEAADVKDVHYIEIGHDGVTPETGWFLKEVEIDMPTKGKHYFFTCKQWLARNKGDGKTSRMFYLQDGEASMVSYKPMVPYEVTVSTGNVKDAGTNSKIYMKIFGANGTTSKIILDKGSDRFERGREDLIKMEFEDIAPLKKIRVGIDGKGDRPEWFLEKIELRNMNTGDLAVFKANQWFSAKRDDGCLERDIVATIKGKQQLKATTYKVTVKTSDLRGAGTNANVFVEIFGENGDSGEIHLKNSETNSSPFKSNSTDVFTLQHLLSLGVLSKVRVWHDNRGIGSAWHLNDITVEDTSSGTKYLFPCNRWLSKSDDDKQICRELPCANAPSTSARDKVSYDIEIITSDKKDAGMWHNAWLILEGEARKSKEFVMENSSRNKILRRGQTDMFTMSSRNLGTLERCVIGAVERDDKPLSSQEGRDSMWHLHQVTVTDKGSGNKYTFMCKNWINIAPKIARKYAKTLEVKDVEESKFSTLKNLGTVKYEVTVHTGDVKSAGTDANVSITICGTFGDTGKRALTQKFRNLFERAQKDTFQLEAIDLGDLTKIEIEHDNHGWGAGWFLDKVEVTNMATSRTWMFPCGQWLDKKKGDGEIRRELLARD